MPTKNSRNPRIRVVIIVWSMNIRDYLPVLAMSPIAKTLLVLNGSVSLFLPILSHRGVLPLAVADFMFLFVLMALAAAYRSGWVFLSLVSVLPLETVNLAPMSLGVDIRPYQFLMLAIAVGFGIRYYAHRTLPDRPRFHVGDLLLLLVPLGSVVASINASDPQASLRMSAIVFSFFGLYTLFRIYVRTSEDVGRILPFVILSVVLTAFSAIAQNLLYLDGDGSFEVMPGRPNGPFAEPDWLGMYLVFGFSILLSSGYLIASRSESVRKALRTKRSVLLFLAFIPVSVALIITVSRSAWIGAGSAVFTAMALVVLIRRPIVNAFLMPMTVIAASVALGSVLVVPLTDFDLSGRAGSIGSGLQSVTVSCEREVGLPDRIVSAEQLSSFGCRHIDLEEIEAERSAGKFVAQIDRNDPNVSIRKEIYARSFALAHEHPILGAGWGTISSVLGQDERGTGLNASNIFLETWIGSGAAGLIGLSAFFLVLLFRAWSDLIRSRGVFPFFMLTVFVGLTVFNLFNSGILLGFFWALLGVSGSYVFREDDFSETL